MDGYDSWMVELTSNLGLLEETGKDLRIDDRGLALGVRLAEDHLHRQVAFEVGVPHAHDHPLAAARELALDLVAVLAAAMARQPQAQPPPVFVE